MSRNYKLRLIAWLFIVLSSVAGLFVIVSNGLSINTNILSLLPNSNTSSELTSATNKFSDRISDDVVFLVSSKDKSKAISSAKNFTSLLKASNNYKIINTGVDNSQMMSWGTFYYPYRQQLISKKDSSTLSNNNYKKIYQNALANIYSPTGVVNKNLIDNDPFFLYQHYLLSLPKPSSKLNLEDGYLLTKNNDRYYVLVKAAINGQSFSLSTQAKIIKNINTSIAKISTNDIEVLKTGMLFYANDGAQSAHNEVNTIGIGSLIGVLLLILITFRSLKPLFFTVFSIFCGFLAAFVTTYLLFGGVFIFTLVFGASLIGISVDYAFFYYCEKLLADKGWTADKGLKRIFWGITLGLINIIIAFLVISIAPFPGLHQLAVFGIIGLSVSYLTVVCLFPFIINLKIKNQKNIPLLHLSDKYLSIWKNMGTRKIVYIIILIVLIAIAGLYRLTPNDDIHILQSTSQKLKNEEDKIKNIIGSDIGLSYIVVLAKNDEKLLEKASLVTSQINDNFKNIDKPYISISDYVPSIKSQRINFNETNKLIESDYLGEYLKAIGYNNSQVSKVTKNLKNMQFEPLNLADWLKQPVSSQMKFLWLGENHGYKSLAIVLSKNINMAQLKGITDKIDGVYLVDKVSEISSVFGHYRTIISYMLAIVVVLLWLGLIARYSFKKATVYICVPILSCLSALAVLGIFNIPLTLFSILALMLVLGIGMDYVIFLAESRSTNFSSTMLALSLSAITTILSFGLLALSNTPAIEYFGLTVLVGITLSFLLAPIVTKVTTDEN